MLRLERELNAGRFRPGKYVTIELFDLKHRIVSAAPFRDRVVHHALMGVVGPIFEAGFIASQHLRNRKHKGTHRAIGAYERYRDAHHFVLRCDIFRFFPAIDHAVLKRDFRRCVFADAGAAGQDRGRLQPAGARERVFSRRRSICAPQAPTRPADRI